MASIRLIKNINLNVEYEGNTETIPFSTGDIIGITKCVRKNDGYVDITLTDGSVIKDVSPSVFHPMGKNFKTEVEPEPLPSSTPTPAPRPRPTPKPRPKIEPENELIDVIEDVTLDEKENIIITKGKYELS